MELRSTKRRKLIEIKSTESDKLSTKLDELPPELIPFIFRNLNFNDLLNCRLINKKYKNFADETIRDIDNLVIYNLDLYNFRSIELVPIWFNNRKSINYDDLITFDKFIVYKSFISKYNKLLSTISNKLQFNLKRLTISSIEDCKKEFNLSSFINYFINLEHLQIFVSEVDFVLIDLPNLITSQIGFEPPAFHLKTPKLTSFKAFNLDEDLTIDYPDSVKYLELVEGNDQIKLFKNLECLSLNAICDINLSKFEKLRKLIINIEWMHHEDEDSFEFVQSKLNAIFQQKSKLRRDNLEIYLQGILIKNLNEYQWPIWTYDGIISNDLKFQLENYDKFGDFIFNGEIKSLDYCKISNFFANRKLGIRKWFINKNRSIKMDDVKYNKIPSDIHKKFFFINSIRIDDKIIDEDQFLCFLLNLPCLEDLFFNYDQTFSQSFYDNLPKLTKLGHLKLNSDRLINYDFLFEIKYLHHFETLYSDYKFTIDLSIKLFKELKIIEYFDLKGDEIDIRIARRHNTFNLTIYNYSDIIFSEEQLEFSKLIELLNKIKNNEFKIVKKLIIN